MTRTNPRHDARAGAALGAFALLLPACEERMPSVDQRRLEAEAQAVLQSVPDRNVDGLVRLFQEEDGVRVKAEIHGATPGKHGFHIHEEGDCTDIDGKSMGGHFAPEGHPHALPSEESERHLGDLGNIEIGPDGTGEIEILLARAHFRDGDDRTLLHKAVVLHQGEDVGKASQPSGSAGTPVACGVIEKD